jgi:DNA polymerase III subunit beta
MTGAYSERQTPYKEGVMPMKCIIDAKELRETLKAVKPRVPLKPYLSIMAYVLLQADELGTHITAYDFEMFGNVVRFPLEAFRSENGACVVRFKDFYDVTAKAEGKVLLEFDKISRLNLSFDNTTLTLKARPENEFPDVRFGFKDFHQGDPNDESISVSFGKFVQATEHVLVATDNSSGQHHFTRGILIDVREHVVNFLGTDGKRLHHAMIDSKQDHSTWQALISTEIAAKLAHLKVSPSESISIGLKRKDDSVYFSWSVDNIEGFCGIMETPYPEWEKVVPSDHEGLIEISADALTKCIDRVSPIAKSDDGREMVVLNGNSAMTVSAKAESMGEGSAKTACNHLSGPDMLVALNYVFLLDALKLHKGKQVQVIFQGDLDPVMLRSKYDASRISVLMPVRLPE